MLGNMNYQGINYGSPTIQNMMQPSYSNVPSFGNIGLGYQGYNQYQQQLSGGYYSGYYNYNPQAIIKQMEEQKKLEEKRARDYIENQKMKVRIYNNYHSIETDEEALEAYFSPQITYSEIQKDINDYEYARQVAKSGNDPSKQVCNMYNYNAMNSIINISNSIRSKHPVDQSFSEYLENSGDLYRDALINENVRMMKKNIGNTYDRQAYSQLANMHRQSSFASLQKNVSVDDLSISLPSHLRQSDSYQERKNQFLNYITQTDPRNRGVI